MNITKWTTSLCIIGVVLTGVAFVLIKSPEDPFSGNRSEIIHSMEMANITRDFEETIHLAEPYLPGALSDHEFSKHLKKAQHANKARIKAENELQTKTERISEIETLISEIQNLARLSPEREALLKRLIKIDPENQSFPKEFERLRHLQDLKSRESEYAANQIKNNELRSALIKKQFSAYDGHHYELVARLKTKLNDPDSFRHQKTTYVPDENHIKITMAYRAKNGFGAVTLTSVSATFSIDGSFIQWNN